MELKNAKKLRRQAEELHHRLATLAMREVKARPIAQRALKRYQRRKQMEKVLSAPKTNFTLAAQPQHSPPGILPLQ